MNNRRPSAKSALIKATLGVLAALCVGLWFVLRIPAPTDWSNTSDLALALEPDASLPISVEETDVIVVLGCTVRKDRMSLYGHDTETTPFLQALSERSVRFANAFSQAPWTRPSMGAWVTGQWPRALQLDNPNPVRLSNRALSPDATTLAERLGAQGYTTIGVVANPNLNTRFGFAQGFDVYDEPDKLWREELDTVAGSDIVASFMAAVEATPSDARIYGRLVFVDTHAPRSPHKQYKDAVGDYAPTKKGRRLASYDASMLQLDQLLADLFVQFKRHRRNVLFVFAADHGEGLNHPGHHGVGHGNHLYPSTTSVPWLVYHPSLKHGGRSVEGLAMGVDLHPTLLDLLGLDVPQGLHGRSFASAIVGEDTHSGREVAFAETFFRKSHKSAAYGETHYLIRDHGTKPKHTDKLYANADWKARTDQSQSDPEAYAALADALTTWETQMEVLQTAAGQPVEIDPRESTMKQLKALGYVD